MCAENAGVTGCKDYFALYLNSRIIFHSAAMEGSSGAAEYWVLAVLKVSPESEVANAVTWHFLTAGMEFFPLLCFYVEITVIMLYSFFLSVISQH